MSSHSRYIKHCLVWGSRFMGHWFSYSLLRIVAALAQCLPHRSCLFLGRGLGRLGFLVLKSRRHLVQDNLVQSCLGQDLSEEQIQVLSKKVFENVGLTVVEFLVAPRFEKEWGDLVTVKPEDHSLVEGVLQERGVIAVLAHFYNWEILGSLSRSLSCDVMAVGQKIKNPLIDRWVKESRKKTGFDLVSKKGFLKKAEQSLLERNMVVIVADQHAGKHGVSMDFLGRAASTFTSPAFLARKTGCPMMMIYDVRDLETGQHRVVIDEVIDPAQYEKLNDEEAIDLMTRKSLDSLESLVKQHPEGWFWLHKRWKI